MPYLCESCGGEEPVQDGVPCSTCGRRNFVLKAEPGVFKVTGFPIGTIVEGDPNNPIGRRVESRPASGGTADSSVEADGTFQASLSGPLDLGRKGERRVMKVLFNNLRERGADVHVEDDARDDFGEDGILVVDGRRTPVQIVTVPNNAAIWKDLNVNKTATLSGDLQAAVSILRDAVVAKSVKGKGTILALDVAHVGAIVNRALVDAYLAAFGDPVAEFSFSAVWLLDLHLAPQSSCANLALSNIAWSGQPQTLEFSESLVETPLTLNVREQQYLQEGGCNACQSLVYRWDTWVRAV